MNKTSFISTITSLFILAILPILFSFKSKSQIDAQILQSVLKESKNEAEWKLRSKTSQKTNDETPVMFCNQEYAFTFQIQSNDLVGEWQLTSSFYDANGNKIIEDSEKKKSDPNAKDYLKLNSDGTCLFYINKLKGRYEIKTQSSGKKKLTIFDKDNNKENRGEIISVSKTELIVLSPGGTFSIYKKL